MANEKNDFAKRATQLRIDTFPKAFDLAYSSFMDLGYDKMGKSFFVKHASDCVMEMRSQCWKEFLEAEKEYTTSVLVSEAERMDFDGAEGAEAVSMFVSSHVTDIYNLCLSNTQSRRSRAGKEFEAIIEMLMMALELPFDAQGNLGIALFSEKNLGKMVDEVVPGIVQYDINKRKTILISAKTTLRERWQEVSEEMVRTGAKEMYLATLDERITGNTLKQLDQENIVVVVPKDIKMDFYKHSTGVISFEDLFSACSNNQTYWDAYDFAEEERKDILDNYQKQIDSHELHPYVVSYLRKMIDRL